MSRRLVLFLALVLIAGPLAARSSSDHPSAHAAEKFRLTLAALAADSPPPPAPFVTAAGVRSCDYIVGYSVPATMPPEVVNATPPVAPPDPPLPANTAVPSTTTTQQLAVFQQLQDIISAHYVYPDYNGVDWTSVVQRYKTLIEQGLTDADFITAMKLMVGDLGDQHSYFQSAAEVKAEADAFARGQDYVGVGAYLLPITGTTAATVLAVYPNSPAAEAGLKPHDAVLSVDGVPLLANPKTPATLGPEGTSIVVSLMHPGGTPFSMRMVRRRVTGFIPIDYCIVANTRVGYIFLPTFFDTSIVDQVRTALQKLTADGPLNGLVLDNRENGGGLESMAKGVLGFFVGGNQGSQVTRTATTPFDVTPENVGGSQTIPLVVLVDWDTASFGEVFSGVLANAGRAKVIGRTTHGNVELLNGYSLSDGSRAWLASQTFAPTGKPPGYWEGRGIIPSISIPTRWDLFAQLNDPALAKAIDLLFPR